MTEAEFLDWLRDRARRSSLTRIADTLEVSVPAVCQWLSGKHRPCRLARAYATIVRQLTETLPPEL